MIPCSHITRPFFVIFCNCVTDVSRFVDCVILSLLTLRKYLFPMDNCLLNTNPVTKLFRDNSAADSGHGLIIGCQITMD